MFDSDHLSINEQRAKLRSEPGIDLAKLTAGTKVYVETDTDVYEITVTLQKEAIVEIWGTDKRMRQPLFGRFLHSVNGRNRQVCLDRWIGKGLRMVIAFRYESFESGMVVSASVEGPNWHYEVF